MALQVLTADALCTWQFKTPRMCVCTAWSRRKEPHPERPDQCWWNLWEGRGGEERGPSPICPEFRATEFNFLWSVREHKSASPVFQTSTVLGVLRGFAVLSLRRDARLRQLVNRTMGHTATGGRWDWGEVSKRRVAQAPKSRNHYRHPKITIWLVSQNPKTPGLTNLKAKALARQRLCIIQCIYKRLLHCPAREPKCLEEASWWEVTTSGGSERWVRKHGV